jgi:hypothetical protein
VLDNFQVYPWTTTNKQNCYIPPKILPPVPLLYRLPPNYSYIHRIVFCILKRDHTYVVSNTNNVLQSESLLRQRVLPAATTSWSLLTLPTVGNAEFLSCVATPHPEGGDGQRKSSIPRTQQEASLQILSSFFRHCRPSHGRLKATFNGKGGHSISGYPEHTVVPKYQDDQERKYRQPWYMSDCR